MRKKAPASPAPQTTGAAKHTQNSGAMEAAMTIAVMNVTMKGATISLPLSPCGRVWRTGAMAKVSRVRGNRVSIGRYPSPALASLGHPLPQGEREKEGARLRRIAPNPQQIRGLFSSTNAAYIERCRGNPAMAINGRRNKPIGPGGSTRRLHQSPPVHENDMHGFWRGRTRIDEGVKGALLLGMVPPLSGQNHSCKRQLCSGCSGCVTQLEIPTLKS
jgi:hypothetical protein